MFKKLMIINVIIYLIEIIEHIFQYNNKYLINELINNFNEIYKKR